MPTPLISRIRLIAIETFKILHKMSPVYLQDLLSYKSSMYSFRYDNLVEVPKARVRTTKYDKSSFCYEAADVWNSLPNDLRKVEDFQEFRRLVSTLSGSSCKCSMCISYFYFCLNKFFTQLLSTCFACITFILLFIPVCFAFTNFLLFFIFNYLRLL